MGAPQFLLDTLSIADVTDRAQHQGPTAQRHGTQADLDGKFGAVAASAVKIEAGAHPSNLWGLRKRGAMLVMLRPETGGHEDFDFLSEQFASLIPEQGLCLGVDLYDGAVLLDGYDGIRDSLKEGAGEQKIAQCLRGGIRS